ncbi:pyridoxamine 5'-phosphate oxidase family protein [Aquabacterium sp.]|uniref:pyridoxamine 5'-phosphate oxidase family protein n=1 Tax=Aquabacterium sp. TaxID=1872578 RepID=UPI002487856A|nr:pyridoxamine 5'-phosphate oxidase family protein [Aquabacterium sp.]MDI1258314.1 pyridoxamine 5'-phosphate oxidase family protein [Aquabacterium sp.]
MTSQNTPEQSLWKLIRDIRFGMLTTQTESGDLCSHPLTTQNRQEDEDSVLWFFISARSDTVRDVLARHKVNVAYASPEDDRYVSISGRARLVNDPAKKQALWSTMSQAWFPGGVDDPDLALLAVDIHQAEYWDVKSSKMVQLLKMAKAAITGKPPSHMGEHEQVHLG